MTTLVPQAIRERLAEHHGSETRYKHFAGLAYTEGVRDLADRCKCNWLIDVVSCWQHKPNVKRMKFQTWTVKRCTDGWAVFMIDEDAKTKVFHTFQHSDFPLDTIKLFCVSGVLMLTSEF